MNHEVIDQLLAAMIGSREGVSDLIFTVGKPPMVEAHGCLEEFPVETPEPVFGGNEIATLVDHFIKGDERLVRDLASWGSCDCSYALKDIARFRVNIFRQNGNQAIVMRKLESEVPTLDELGLPPIFREMIKERNGIIFVTGATGTGKTTTLAAMLDELNQTQHIHIITLEDPIEFLHPHRRAVFHQRELGKDFPDFARGLRASLRQAPKVILVGEVRDRETVEIAMTASETGHLVFATLHTINAGQSIKRILGMFSTDEEQLLRQRLAETVRYIVSQRLVGKIGGGRHLVTEIMGSNLSTREAIMYGEKEDRSFQDIIETNKAFGWHSFDQELIAAYENGLISQETAMLHCTLKNKMRRDLEAVNKRRRAHIDEPSGLNLDPTTIKRSETIHV